MINQKNRSHQLRINNCKKQSKRLAKLLCIDLHAAQDVVAKAIYKCSGWEDLIGSLCDEKCTNPRINLACIVPSSDTDQLHTLEINVPDIVIDLNRHIMTNRDRLGLMSLVWSVFGFKEQPPRIEDIYPILPGVDWRSAEIGPDSHAVLHADITLNNVSFRLIATRCHMPEYYNWDDPELADYADELRDSSLPVRIIWHNPEKWEKQTRDFALLLHHDPESIEGDSFPPSPEIKLCRKMLAHKQWFDSIETNTHSHYDFESLPIPLEFNTGLYMVFGIPIADKNLQSNSLAAYLELAEVWGHESIAVQLNGQFLSFEYLDSDLTSNNTEIQDDEYSDNLSQSVFAHQDCLLQSIECGAMKRKVAFLAPATKFQIRYQGSLQLKCEANETLLQIQSDNTELAIILLDKIYARDIYRDGINQKKFYAILNLEKNANGPSIAGTYTTKSGFSTFNFISSCVSRKCDSESIHYLNLSSSFLALTDMHPKKHLINAIKNGVIFHFDEKTEKELDLLPSWTLDLPTLNEIDKNIFNPKIDIQKLGIHSQLDLFSHSKRIIYERDIY